MGNTVIAVECVIVTTLVVAFALMLLLRVISRSRPQLSIATPFAVGFTMRLLVIALLSALGIGAKVRDTPDELTWMAFAHHLATLPFGAAEWIPFHQKSYLQVLVFASQLKVLGSPEDALRVTQVGISLAGTILIAAAVYDLSGAKAARLTAWLLALEPASLLFNSLLVKEPLLELAAGLVVFGATRVWRRLDLAGIAIMGAGAVIGLGARGYVGWILVSCAVVVILHASMRGLASGRLRSLPLIYGVAIVAAVAMPAILAATSHKSLEENLQPLHNAESTSTGGAGSHLALEKINYSSRGAIIANLPKGVENLLLQPYPWQVGNINQTIGVAGSLFALTVFFLLIRFAIVCRGEVMSRAGPPMYPFLFIMVAYALADGNAGQGYRYRTHLVTIAVAAMVVLRAAAIERREPADDRSPAEQARERAPAGQRAALRYPRPQAHGTLPPAAWARASVKTIEIQSRRDT
jgi:hypothetical protein